MAAARNPRAPCEAYVLLADDFNAYVFFQIKVSNSLCEKDLLRITNRARADIRH